MTPFHRSIKDADGVDCTVDVNDGHIELESCGWVVLTREQSKLLRCALEAAERAVPATISPNDVWLPGGFPSAPIGDSGVQVRKAHAGERCLALTGRSIRGSLVFTPEQVRELRRIIKPFEAQA